jgi:hypothetical protein
MRKLICVILLLLPMASARAMVYDDITVNAEKIVNGRTSHGYCLFRITVTNSSPTKTHAVGISIPKRTYGYGTHLQEISKSIVVAPGATIEVPILQPPLMMQGNEIDITIDGKRQDDGIPFSGFEHCMSWGSNEQPQVLVSENAGYDEILKQAAVPAPGPNSMPMTPPGPVRRTRTYSGRMPSSGQQSEIYSRADMAVTSWSDNWLAYTCYDGIIVTAGDMHDMPQAVQDAMFDYVRAGGSLAVLGNWTSPPLKDSQAEKNGPFTSYRMGFGIVMVSSEQQVSHWSHGDFTDVAASCWQESQRHWQGNDIDYATLNSKFSIVDVAVPIRGLFMLVLVFAIAIGPVNLYLLSKWKRRIWMLWTVPVVSGVTCLAIFFYAVFAEGWQPYSRTLAVTILDQPSHKATTLGWMAFYAPLTPRDGLHFDLDTEVAMQGMHYYGTGSENKACVLDVTQDQHLASGWISSRVPVHFNLRKNEVRRERLTFSAENGQIKVANGLGIPIRALYYMEDKAGQKIVHEGRDIAAGAQVQLNSGPGFSPTSETRIYRDFLAGDWIVAPEGMDNFARRMLRPGSYVAICDVPLFLEPGLKTAKSKQTQTIIIGITEDQQNAG